MARYKMEDGTIVDTDKASKDWQESSDWDGRNHISRNTGSQWHYQHLYRSRKGRYYMVRTSAYQGSMPSAEWISEMEAARWLLHNDEELPEDLKHLEAEVIE